MKESKYIKAWNKLRKKDLLMPEPLIEYMPDIKRYRIMKRIIKQESKEERQCQKDVTKMTDKYAELIKLGYESILLQSLSNKELKELWEKEKEKVNE